MEVPPTETTFVDAAGYETPGVSPGRSKVNHSGSREKGVHQGFQRKLARAPAHRYFTAAGGLDQIICHRHCAQHVRKGIGLCFHKVEFRLRSHAVGIFDIQRFLQFPSPGRILRRRCGRSVTRSGRCLGRRRGITGRRSDNDEGARTNCLYPELGRKCLQVRIRIRVVVCIHDGNGPGATVRSSGGRVRIASGRLPLRQIVNACQRSRTFEKKSGIRRTINL